VRATISPKIASITLFLMFLLNFTLANIIKLGGSAAYLVPPVIWLAMFIVSYPNTKPGIFPYRSLVLPIVSIACFFIFLRNMLGFITGFGLSPYVTSLQAIGFNMYFFTSRILGFEHARTFMVQKMFKTKENIVNLLEVALLFTILDINFMQFFYVSSELELIKYLSSELLPVFSLNIFLTYLVFWGGALSSITFIAINKGYYYFTPIIPDIPWTLESILGALMPFIGIVILSNTKLFSTYVVRENERIGFKGIIQIITPLIILLIAIGLFGLRPLIVGSGSMQPTLNVGDVVIITKVSINDIAEGDIIAYVSEQGIVVHRVYKIVEEENKYLVITKGDANNEPDNIPVDERLIIGKVVVTIPKVGLLQLYMREIFLKIQEVLSQTLVLISLYTPSKLGTIISSGA